LIAEDRGEFDYLDAPLARVTEHRLAAPVPDPANHEDAAEVGPPEQFLRRSKCLGSHEVEQARPVL